MKPLDPIKEAQAVTALKESIAALGEEGDISLLLDSVEGETSFFEAVDAILAKIQDDKALIAAVDVQIADLKARKERFTKRAETNKALIEQAFIVADLPKVERPLGTLFLSSRAPKVLIETESDIPTRYWKPADPVLDGKALGDDLKAMRENVEALLGEPGEDRDAAISAFCQRFLDHEGAKSLRDHLAVLDTLQGDERAQLQDAIRQRFTSIPGASLSGGSRSLSIRVA